MIGGNALLAGCIAASGIHDNCSHFGYYYMCCSDTLLFVASHYLDDDLVAAQNHVDIVVVVVVLVAHGIASAAGLVACVGIAAALHAHDFDIVDDVVAVVSHDFVAEVAAAHKHVVVGDVVADGPDDGIVVGGDDVVVTVGLADDNIRKRPCAWRQNLQ